MCGIAGYLGGESAEALTARMRPMLAAIAHRGPNSEGQHQWAGCVLGHRRLSILDLSPAGHQPMLSDDGRIGIVFNGCIYNFLDLRAELEQAGHRFRSQCDTEVLVRGYQEWGLRKMLPKLRGMFAFAIWDDPQQKLSLVRDRMGVKPLVYATEGKRFAFGSISGVLASTGMTGDLSPGAALEFLEYGYIGDPRSIYSGIHKLLPGHLLEWCDGKVLQERYWTLPETGTNTTIQWEEAIEESERLLLESVRLRLQADVPIAALLSGGIDSTLVCWAMKQLNVNIKAFTVGAPGAPEDESADARLTAQKLGIPHEVVMLGASDRLELDEFFKAYSEPFAAQSAFGILRVSRAVKEHATVLLTGDGADDVYLGYPHFMNVWRAQELADKLPSASTAIWERVRPLASGITAMQRGVSYLDYATGGLGPYIRRRNGLDFLRREQVLGPQLNRVPAPWRDLPASMHSARKLFQDAFQYHWDTHFTGEFMPKVDQGTMLYALEARAPFLDHKMWEFATSLPVKMRLAGGKLKSILREIVHRRVGPEVGARPKQGFSVPVSRWLMTEQRQQWEILRDSRRLRDLGWIEKGSLDGMLDRALEQREAPPALWHLLVLAHWLERNA